MSTQYITHLSAISNLTSKDINLVHLGILHVHPMIRPIFCNIFGINWQY